jgi:hypothetical protein
MRLVVWKTVQSREGKSDEFFFSFGKESLIKGEKPLFMFCCSEEAAKEAFGEEVSKIVGICIVHPIKLTLFMREEKND